MSTSNTLSVLATGPSSGMRKKSLQIPLLFAKIFALRKAPRTMQDFLLWHLIFLHRKFVVEASSFAYTFQPEGGKEKGE